MPKGTLTFPNFTQSMVRFSNCKFTFSLRFWSNAPNILPPPLHACASCHLVGKFEPVTNAFGAQIRMVSCADTECGWIFAPVQCPKCFFVPAQSPLKFVCQCTTWMELLCWCSMHMIEPLGAELVCKQLYWCYQLYTENGQKHSAPCMMH